MTALIEKSDRLFARILKIGANRSAPLCVQWMLILVLGLSVINSSRGETSLPPAFDIDPSPLHPRSTEGSFVTLRSGRIIFDYSQFSEGQDDHSPSAIAEIYSDDQGRTWSQPKVVVPTGNYQNIMSVSLLRLASGKLLRFHAVKKTKWLDCHVVFSVSTDEAVTWSEPKLMSDAPGYFVLNNDRVIQTASGRLIVPLGYHRSPAATDERSSWDARAITLWYYSDDEGATWKESENWWGIPVASGSGLQEPGVVQVPDGSIYSWARTDQGVQFQFMSRDNGTSFSAPERSVLMSPNSPASIKRLPHTDTLMAVYNDHSGKVPAPKISSRRAPLAVAFSVDGAKTWGPSQLIEEDLGGWYCYTAIHFTDDAVLLAYVAGNDQIGHLSRLRLRRIPLASLHVPQS